MIPAELERLVLKAKEEGKHPYFVNATAGTTVFGAFDPINELADICDKHSLWLHIDVISIILLIDYWLIDWLIHDKIEISFQGAWGSSLLLSKKYRQGRFDGVER